MSEKKGGIDVVLVIYDLGVDSLVKSLDQDKVTGS